LNLTRTELDRLKLKPGMRVLEVGPGPGRLLVPAARRVLPGGEVVGVELQPEMARRLRARAVTEAVSNLTVVVGDATERYCEPERFDLVYMVTVLGEIPDRQAALGRAHEALKPGGILSVTETFPDPHYQTQTTVLGLARETGFELIEVRGPWYHYTANFFRA
jgi:ubiquinone/menaquinone biosynthesis C-methylase UbiE